MFRFILLSLIVSLVFPPVGLAILVVTLIAIAARRAGRDGGVSERNRADAYMGTGRYRPTN